MWLPWCPLPTEPVVRQDRLPLTKMVAQSPVSSGTPSAIQGPSSRLRGFQPYANQRPLEVPAWVVTVTRTRVPALDDGTVAVHDVGLEQDVGAT